MEPRIVAIWDNGAFISSLCDGFQVRLLALVEQYGQPDKVEYRDW